MPREDLSTALLVDHMNEVDKRRRMMSVSQKEFETKMMLATQDAKELRKTADAMDAEEEELKRELDSLTEEQRKVELQLVVESSRARHCETEEPLLRAHAAEQLLKLDAQWRAFHEKSEELEELRQAFTGDQVVSGLRETIRQLEEDLRTKKQEKEVIEKEVLEFTVELARLRDPMRSQLTPESNALLPSFDPAPVIVEKMDITAQHAAQELKQQIQQEKLKFEQVELLHRRQLTILQTEVEDLEMRTKELSSVLQGVSHSREQLESSLRWLHQCLEHKMCFNCMQNHESKNT
ncbi:unnamed protein product [Phytomonas sp. EM1]|nr:unnamed protein product [Phytomonas sp. EM1]|eukprot:CCW61598.1 unnamed protein product [Phytomonas sp. isolate EM1]